ncbi:hypothetical protein Zmor_024762 [Zophobas morio]|uniref:Uncharacterized protein n=1 Tax=Zophobas morio TaxID=2755281 RepID=A0AA38HZ47_9CUCU|nr:hypothetical protein Zmor_024762 [Zophobas morio]
MYNALQTVKLQLQLQVGSSSTRSKICSSAYTLAKSFRTTAVHICLTNLDLSIPPPSPRRTITSSRTPKCISTICSDSGLPRVHRILHSNQNCRLS